MILPAALSPSSLSTYARCPGQWRQRYVEKLKEPASPEMLFGTSVHCGLEALFTGKDAEVAFLQEWRKSVAELKARGVLTHPTLMRTGLDLVEAVTALGLRGKPELQCWVTAAELSRPIRCFVDLWDEESNTLYDFKTAGRAWSESNIHGARFQSAFYTQAYVEATKREPRFVFVVLPRLGGTVQLLDATQTPGMVARVVEETRQIAAAIEADRFDCTCKPARHQEPAA